VRRLYQDRILAGFAAAPADAFTLFERFEAKLDKHQGNLMRSAVELAKDWRTRPHPAASRSLLAVADHEHSLIITGAGDVLEPSRAWSPSARAGLTRRGRGSRSCRTPSSARATSSTRGSLSPPTLHLHQSPAHD